MRENLPDYYQALAAAIARLERNTRTSRAAIYDRARRLLIEEAHAADPPWPLIDVVREQRTLEEAIEAVESAYAVEPEGSRSFPSFRSPVEQGRRPSDEYRRSVSPRAPSRMPVLSPTPAAPRLSREFPRLPPLRPLWLWSGFAAILVAVGLLLGLLLRPGGAPLSGLPPADMEAAGERLSAEERARLALEYIERGNERSRAQDYEGAIAAYSEAIRLGPRNAAVYNNRAFAYWSRGETNRAIADYDQAIRLEPDNIVALTNRAVAYNFRGDYELAIRDLDRALRLQPENPDVLNSRCWGRALAGQMQAALADCNEALRLRPNDANTLDSRGFTYLKMGDYDRAIADYNTALRLDPKLAASLYGRGIARIRAGDEAGGKADIAAAKAARPEIEAIFARYGVR